MTEELKYNATEKDEEEFFLMYNMNIQPSEVKQMSDEYRQWLIARLIAQKDMEAKEMAKEMQSHLLMPNIQI